MGPPLLCLTIAVVGSIAGATRPFVDWTALRSEVGDGIPDFSFCGYHSSDVSLPALDTEPSQTLQPSDGDQAQRIQAALDGIAQRGGGVLLLSNGTFWLNSSLVIPNRTVLRGSGRDQTILLPSNGDDTFITIGTKVDEPAVTPVQYITNDYVPVGATSFNVEDASCFRPGQTIMVQRNVTKAWVIANGMNDLYRNGEHQTWLPVDRVIRQPRKVKWVDGNQVTMDVPLADSLNREYMVPQVALYDFPHSHSEMGVENLSIKLSPTCSGAPLNGTGCKAAAITFTSWTVDSWIRDLDITGFNAAVATGVNTMRVTMDSVNVFRDGPTDPAAGYAFDFSISGTQILVKDCGTYGDESTQDYPVATQTTTAGPNAVVNYFVEQLNSPIQPHQRWGFGFLIDNSVAPVSIIDRNIDGSGHGWTMNAGVVWNSASPLLSVSSPPLGTNWCVGCRSGGINTNGNKTEIILNGTWIESNRTVTPQSLFQAQLDSRHQGGW